MPCGRTIGSVPFMPMDKPVFVRLEFVLRRKRDYIELTLCLALVFVVPVLVCAPIVFEGNTPYRLDSLRALAPWQDSTSAVAHEGQSAASRELIERYYPWYSHIVQTREYGGLPLWNVHEELGVPFLALWRTRALSLFSLPFYLFDLHVAAGISIFLKMVVAGLSAYYCTRRFQFSPPFALIVAITFQMSGLMLVGHWHPVSDVAPFFPLLLPVMQRLILGHYRVWPFLALIFTLVIAGGDPESLIALMLFLPVLSVLYCIRTGQRRHVGGAIAFLALSIVMGAGLAGVQLVPFIEFLKHGSIDTTNSAYPIFHWQNMVAALAGEPFQEDSIVANGSLLLLPGGMIGLLLTPLWLAVRPFSNRVRRRRVEAFLLTTLFFIFIVPLTLGYANRIPGLSLMGGPHFMIFYPLAITILGATAMDEWIHLDADKCKTALAKLLWLAPLCWGFLFSGPVVYLLLWKSDESPFLVLKISLLCLLAIIVLLAITLLWPRPAFAAYSLVCLTFAALWAVYTPTARLAPAMLAAQETHFIGTLRGQESRVAGTGRLGQWPLSPHGISQIYTPAGASLNRSRLFITEAQARPELFRLTASRALLLTKDDLRGVFAKLRPMLNLQEVFPSGAILLTDLHAAPRVHIVYAGRAVEDHHGHALRASGPPLLEGGTLPPIINEAPPARATVVRETHNQLVISADSPRPGVLILADAWYPGWRATIDGVPTPVFPVDVAFRGIEISEGTHEIVFEYRPFSLRLGAYISLGSAVIMLASFYAWFKRRNDYS